MQSGWEEAEEPTKKTGWSRSHAAGTFGGESHHSEPLKWPICIAHLQLPVLQSFSVTPSGPCFSTEHYWMYTIKSPTLLGVMVHIFSPLTREAEAGTCMWAGDQPGLHSEFRDNPSYMVRTSLH